MKIYHEKNDAAVILSASFRRVIRVRHFFHKKLHHTRSTAKCVVETPGPGDTSLNSTTQPRRLEPPGTGLSLPQKAQLQMTQCSNFHHPNSVASIDQTKSQTNQLRKFLK